MQNTKNLIHSLPGCFAAVLALCLFAGCKTEQSSSNTASTPTAAVTVPAATTAPAAAPAATAAPAAAAIPAPVAPPVRIKAGLAASLTDSEGNVWLPDQGFADGDIASRDDDLQITNTTDQALYRSEHYGMTSFSYPVPNGKYIVKLHFAETFDGITGPDERVFSFSVGGHQFDDFDAWVKAGGSNRAYVETTDAEVTDGKLNITFTAKTENPEINGIEILPAP